MLLCKANVLWKVANSMPDDFSMCSGNAQAHPSAGSKKARSGSTDGHKQIYVTQDRPDHLCTVSEWAGTNTVTQFDAIDGTPSQLDHDFQIA